MIWKALKKLAFFTFAMALVLIVSTGVSKAATYGDLTYEISDGKVTITDCKESASGELVIPDTIEGYPVTSIGDFAFHGCSSLSSVTIPDSVTSIGSYAFRSCRSLTGIAIPDSVTSIGADAFSWCSSLTSVTIPDSVTSIGSYAFSGCSGLTSVVIGNRVTSIGSYAFQYCSSLTYEIYDNAKYLGNGNNPYMVLMNATSESIVSCQIHPNTKVIADAAFYNCSSLTSITIPDSVTSIGDYAFQYCSSLTSITIPDSVTSIGSYAFYNCSSLTSIAIPDSVTSIGSDAFYNCNKLKHVAYGGTQNQWKSISIGSYNEKLTGATRHYEASADAIYYVENCINAGLFCSICNDFITRESETDGSHTVRILPATVTCTQAGLTEGKVCEICEMVLVAQEEIAALGHDYKDNVCVRCETIDLLAYLTYEISGGKVTITDCRESASGELVIPDTIEGYPVTSIGNSAFSFCDNLTSIIIPDSVETIGKEAFYGCYGLSSVSIPNSITIIDAYAFAACDNLTAVIIPDSVTTIGEYAFGWCGNLESISIGNGVVSIPRFAFFHCTSLTLVTIGNSVGSIGEAAFFDCASLTTITIPQSVRSIEFNALEDCINLTGIWVDANNPSYSSDENGALYNKDKTKLIKVPAKLTGEYFVRDGVITIGAWALSRCSGLTAVTIPNSVTTIDNGAFVLCYNLAEISFGNSVSTIGDSAFEWCEGLTKIVFTGDAPQIREHPFYDASVTVYYPANNKTWTDEVRQNYGGAITWVEKEEETDSPLTFTLNDDGQSYSVTNCDESASGELVIPATYNGKPVITIGDDAFSYCKSLTAVTIPDSVTTIGKRVFYYCTSLTAVTIGNSVTTIGKSAFSYCDNLTAVTIPDSVTTIGDYAFRECLSLTAVTIPDRVTTIGDYAFLFCDSLTSVTIGNSVTTIGNSAFDACSSLTGIWVDEDNPNYSSDVAGVLFDKNQVELIQAPGGLSGSYDIPDSVTTIGDSAFSCCESLTSVTIPDSVTTIGDHAFEYCGLTSITIPDSVTTICDYAFYACDGLTSIIIPDGITTIGNGAFKGCYGLTSVTIMDSVTTLGYEAFSCCYSLTSITIPDGVTTIGDSAFSWCTALTAVTIPDSVTSIGDYAFYDCTSLTEIQFAGDAPEIGEDAFLEVTATAYYPAGNDTWTEDVRQSYGGTITWVANAPKEPVHVTIPGVEGTFTSFADVIAAYDPATQYIKLTGDVAVDLTLTKDLKIDLNGFTLSGVIDLNGNAVYGVDNTTDGYTCEAIGYFNCVDENGDPVVPAAHFKTDKATYGAVKRYLAVQDENGWSFHRFYFGITHATLNTSNGGIGYKAAFAGDEMVKAALGVKGAYGIELAVNEDFSACVTTRFAAFEFPNAGVAQTRTLLLQNILASGMTLEEMTANATMPIYARTYLETADGTVIQSSVFQITLQQMVQSMDESFTTFAPAQQLHLKAFYATYADLFKDWELGNL